MIQTLSLSLFQDHYVFCHDVVDYYVDSFETYSNLDF